MTKTLISLRISDLTKRQIGDLQKVTGMNQTELISVAIDRMAREERKMDDEYKAPEMLFFVLARDEDRQVVSCVPGADPLYGNGSWNVMAGPFNSWDEAYQTWQATPSPNY